MSVLRRVKRIVSGAYLAKKLEKEQEDTQYILAYEGIGALHLLI